MKLISESWQIVNSL